MKKHSHIKFIFLMGIILTLFCLPGLPCSEVYAENKLILVQASAEVAAQKSPMVISMNAVDSGTEGTQDITIPDDDVPLVRVPQRESIWGVDKGWPLVIFGGIAFIVFSLIMRVRQAKLRK